MRIIRADNMGMCFGVRDALNIMTKIGDPSTVTIHGELVHNEIVLDDLNARGFHSLAESMRDGVPETEEILITAHGVSERERARLKNSGKRLIDTTCPLVRRAHEAAVTLRDEGRHVLVIGKRDHVEVRGLVGDLRDFDVLETVEDVATYPHKYLGVLCQTTKTESEVDRIRSRILEMNPLADVHFIDTVCRPTKDHQRALERLIDQVDAVVVVGGRNSNNTRALAARVLDRGRQALHIQRAGDLDESWFHPEWTVGLTAGTSSLDTTIEEVYDALSAIAARLELTEVER